MITIFTPTYNRAYILHRLYNSLLKQTDKKFEWVVVDDGSTDNTESLLKSWIEENKVNIRYFKQENQGKMIAHNKGVEEAKGELFVCVDSDDYLTPEATKAIQEKWDIVKNKKKCVGIVGSRIYENGNFVGTGMPKNLEYATLRDLSLKYKYKGDTILVYRTEIIKKYKFPKIEGEKFIPEGYLYDKIDQEGELAIIQEKLYVCEYLPDGYTANTARLIKNNPKGYILVAEQRLKISNTIGQKIKCAAKIILGNWLANQKGYIKKSSNKLIMILALPFAYIVYIAKYKKLGEN